MARLATSAVHLCQRLQELNPQKLLLIGKQSEQSSPFRRWTTGSGAGSSYRHHEHRNIYNKQMSEGSNPGGGKAAGGGGGVARWSLGLEHLLTDAAGAAAFAHFLDKEFAAENIRFWWSCEQYRTCSENETESAEVRASLANEIWQRHLADKAPEPVNIDAAAKRATALRLDQRPPPPDLFNQAQKQIFNVMKFDSYPRFLRSGVHAECARADLRGLPCPYLATNDTPKIKKSSSNASERRRSGGGSLLGWRLRSVSRDRAVEDTPPTTDVVAASQTLAGGCSLCRVVLPDGATSVVGVDEAVTVRRLVDRLLQRRNLLCTAYDVLLDEQGESRAIDAESPSTVLGGKCAVVERRCVVRVRIGPRAVLVRCRPTRRLRHVLRPLLQRYPPDSSSTQWPQGTPLNPDTSLQELDGARLQIVEVGDGEWRAVRLNIARTGDRDEDTDSLPDVALHPHDDDTLSIDRNSGSSGYTDVSQGSRSGAPSAITSGSTQQAPLPQGPVPANRVRASLRPGPPLHHHPPDFLENLRETQRQRLLPRTPPPLPPKPTQRTAPTVV
ncbi:unnamed protein product [Leptosia nina]|uniref:Regulator of G-protein signaling loco n=1 Tax=Leptosia nina TaxID=320188 RepID=A0AAV1J7N3_9NEOP